MHFALQVARIVTGLYPKTVETVHAILKDFDVH